MKNCKKIRTNTETLTIKGTLTDGMIVEFLDDDKDPQEIQLENALEAFIGQPVSITVKMSSDEELDVVESSDDYEE